MTNVRRCACGYLWEHHEWPSTRCPDTKTGKFRDPPAPPRMRPWSGPAMVPVVESGPEAPSPVVGPLVPARYAAAAAELAPAALKLGHLARDRAWQIDPWYWQASDGTETSALVMHRGGLRAFATWQRKVGATWRTAGGLAWRHGAFPVPIGVQALAGFIQEM